MNIKKEWFSSVSFQRVSRIYMVSRANVFLFLYLIHFIHFFFSIRISSLNIFKPPQSCSPFYLHQTNLQKLFFWKTQLLPFLRGKNLQCFIDGSNPCPPSHISVEELNSTLLNPSYISWIQQDQLIMSLLISSLLE